mmetsp:Transcript_47127/g.100224  ORF Transcript_47127/g.100224 Transcript_47127/m.100224 type:complete len:213 (+) Transcript_47127:939-1577(+)
MVRPGMRHPRKLLKEDGGHLQPILLLLLLAPLLVLAVVVILGIISLRRGNRPPREHLRQPRLLALENLGIIVRPVVRSPHAALGGGVQHHDHALPRAERGAQRHRPPYAPVDPRVVRGAGRADEEVVEHVAESAGPVGHVLEAVGRVDSAVPSLGQEARRGYLLEGFDFDFFLLRGCVSLCVGSIGCFFLGFSLLHLFVFRWTVVSFGIHGF